MVYDNICRVEIDPTDTIKDYVAEYTNGMKKDVQAHNMDEAWFIAYIEPYEVLDVIVKRR